MKRRLGLLALAGAIALGGLVATSSSAQADHRSHERLRTAFLRYDINHDGMLGQWELRHAPRRMQRRLWQADRNRDGWITRWEMRATFGVHLIAPRPVVRPQPIVRPRPIVRPQPVYQPPRRIRDHRRSMPAPRAGDWNRGVRENRDHRGIRDRHDDCGDHGVRDNRGRL